MVASRQSGLRECAGMSLEAGGYALVTVWSVGASDEDRRRRYETTAVSAAMALAVVSPGALTLTTTAPFR